MEEKLKSIDVNNEKVLRIINSAFEIFVKNDFEKASINNIVKSAGVSKGLIYHYFKDKNELFDFLFAFAAKESTNKFKKEYNWDDLDFFDRYKIVLNDKLDAIKVYPYMVNFFIKYRSHLDVKKIKTEFENDYPRFRDNIYCQNTDLDIVKDGVDYYKMVNIVCWTIKGMTQEFIDNHSVENLNEKMDSFKDDCCEYMQIIKTQFYKT